MDARPRWYDAVKIHSKARSVVIVWYVLIFILILVAATEWSTFRTGVPTLASFPPARRKMVEVLKKSYDAHTGTEPYNVIDLGSGNGQLATKIARTLPSARVTGIEISVVPWTISYLRNLVFGPANLVFRRVNFFPYDCSKADAIAVYLNPQIMERVSKKLRDELKTGAIVVANDCPLGGDWQPIETIDTGLFKMKVYVYQQA
jgi:SAM-dependent methyltransferase